MVKVKFKKREYLMEYRSDKDEARLLDENGSCVAYVYSNGDIMKYGKIIGHRSNLRRVK